MQVKAGALAAVVAAVRIRVAVAAVGAAVTALEVAGMRMIHDPQAVVSRYYAQGLRTGLRQRERVNSCVNSASLRRNCFRGPIWLTILPRLQRHPPRAGAGAPRINSNCPVVALRVRVVLTVLLTAHRRNWVSK